METSTEDGQQIEMHHGVQKRINIPTCCEGLHDYFFKAIALSKELLHNNSKGSDFQSIDSSSCSQRICKKVTSCKIEMTLSIRWPTLSTCLGQFSILRIRSISFKSNESENNAKPPPRAPSLGTAES